jgi:hypothetical protein
MTAPTCECVWCVADREAGQDEYLLFTVEPVSGTRRYYNPNTGAPTFVPKNRAPRVGPQHVKRAPGLRAERMHDTAGWYEIGMRAVPE